jgi:hypothetical protein
LQRSIGVASHPWLASRLFFNSLLAPSYGGNGVLPWERAKVVVE